MERPFDFHYSRVAGMSHESSEVRLLAVVGELHRAGRNPVRWAAALDMLGQYLDCPGMFGGGALKGGEGISPDEISCLSKAARECAYGTTGRCGRGESADEGKRRLCMALVDHLDMALNATHQQADSERRKISHEALETIVNPIFVCDTRGFIVHINQAAREELDRGRWFVAREGRLFTVPEAGAGMAQPFTPPAPSGETGRWHLDLTARDSVTAELWIRALLRQNDPERLFLLSLLIHGFAATEPGDAGFRQLGLTPRQSELARLLVGGATVTDAAKAMGISRNTAKDHLAKLFEISRTHRQTDLVVWLTRTFAA